MNLEDFMKPIFDRRLCSDDLRPRLRRKPVAVVEICEDQIVIGAMLVDENGMNCVRHEGDQFPLIMERSQADALLEAARRLDFGHDHV